MKFEQINDFVVQHTGPKNLEFFEKDRELFVKTFPSSKILGELARVNEYNKEQLQGRILLELLNADVCPDCILENRGHVIDHAPSFKTAKEAKAILLGSSIDDLDFDKEIKPMVEIFKLEVSDGSKFALTTAVNTYRESILKSIKDAEKAARAVEEAAKERAAKISKWVAKTKEDAQALFDFVTDEELKKLKWTGQLNKMKLLTTGEGKKKAEVIAALLKLRAEAPAAEETKGTKAPAEETKETDAPAEETKGTDAPSEETKETEAPADDKKKGTNK